MRDLYNSSPFFCNILRTLKIQFCDSIQILMKKNLTIFLMGTAFIYAGCGSKSGTNETASSEEPTEQKIEYVVSKRAEIDAQRKMELADLIAISPYYKNANGKTVYYKAEVDPSYIGGMDAMKDFLKENLTYPDAAEDDALEGTVFVDFVVAENGKVTEVTATSNTYGDADALFSAEALRVVNLMPDWEPGRQNGQAVDVKYSVPITFMAN
jgi:TonB family protein